jgi:hypothetical protein
LSPNSSSVIEDISHCCEGSTQQAYGYFFFDGRDSQKGLQRHEDLLRSLIWQFSDQFDDLGAALNDLYDRCGSGVRQPSLGSLQGTLFLILDGFCNAYVIVDALDECSDRGRVLNWIKEMTRWKVGKLHFLVTSRQERDIELGLQPLEPVSICLEGESVDLDIATYLDQMLQDNEQPTAWNKDAHIRDRVKISLLTGAQGMYDTIHIIFGAYMTDVTGVLGSDG